MSLRSWITTLLVFAASSVSASPADDEAKIRAALARWVKSFNSGDLKAAAQVWAPDLDGWAPEGADDTFAQEQEYAAKASGKLPGATYTLQINEVIVSGDLAVCRDTWTETPRADSAKARTFRSFEVWRRQPDGSWKIARWIDGPVKEAKSPRT